MNTTPVEVQEPLATMPLTKAFVVPGSIPEAYRVEAAKPDGTTEVFPSCRAYTRSITDTSGRLKISLGGKRHATEIPFPFHYIHRNSVLCATKVHKMATMSGNGQRTFGLNYDLFALPWQLCLILHNVGGTRQVLFSTRQEWERGDLAVLGCELQMFLSVPEDRSFDVDTYRMQASGDICRIWLDAAEASMSRKGV